MTGTIFGIGVGPGDPELITLKGARLLGTCPVIAYPAPLEGESLARHIAAPHIPNGRVEIVIRMPIEASRFPAQDVYARAATEIAGHSIAGRDVAVLCEGDPFFYGSFMYLYERLEADYCCEIVPGVSSLMSASAVLKRPLAARNDVLTIIPAPLPNNEIDARIAGADAIAFIKVGRHFERIRALLERLNLTGSAAYVERASLANQQIMPLAQMNADTAPYFSMILVYKGAEKWISGLDLERCGQ